jgi:hypothetical protein
MTALFPALDFPIDSLRAADHISGTGAKTQNSNVSGFDDCPCLALFQVVLFLLIGSLITLSRLGGRKRNGSLAGAAARNATPV